MSYKPFTTFIFRTPYFPVSVLSDFEAKQNGAVFREMLQIASPDLSQTLETSDGKAQYSAYRYFQRACTRSTPFGLFAGCSVGTIGEKTRIYLSEQADYKRVTRLDMNYICALIQQIERSKNTREALHYFPNTSLYPIGNHTRYVEYHYRKMRRMHQITQVENSEYLHTVISLAKNGAQFSNLAKALVDDEITLEDAKEFIHDLIDAQVLVSELEPAVTVVQPLFALVAKLNRLQVTEILPEIEAQLSAINQQPIGKTCDIYPAIIANIEKTKIETEIKYLFQADMFKPAQSATVSRNIIKDIQRALTFLNKITASGANSNLSQFKGSFLKRYEEREMPLLFVLDKELGIGYAGNTSGDNSPLVDDLVIPRKNHPASAFQTALYQKYRQSSQNFIELTDEDVKGIEANWDDLPPTFSVMCQVLQDDEHGRSVYIQTAGGQSATSLLGRFCHLDEQILNHALSITEKEAQMNPNVIYAEIVHLPESRIGNILLRPVLRPYEIPYLAKSGVSGEFEVKLSDLYISVKENRIVLRSKQLNKEIVPRMSTAHNYSGQNSMPIYHFLCDMQHQNGRAGLGFFWNDTMQQLDYLPRVIYKNCILSQARWIVREKEIKTFIETKNDNELLAKIKEWQAKREIPDTVVLADGDNELYVDLNNPLSIRAWLSVVKKRPTFKLEEFLFKPATAVVHGSDGVFSNEFIFAFYRDSDTKKK